MLTTSLDKGNGYTLNATDWNGKPHTLTVDNTTAAISIDLGFMSEITGFEIKFGEYTGENAIFSTPPTATTTPFMPDNSVYMLTHLPTALTSPQSRLCLFSHFL